MESAVIAANGEIKKQKHQQGFFLKLPLWQFIAIFVGVVILGVLVIKVASAIAAANSSAYLFLLVIFTIMLFSKISVLNQYGISLYPFLLFGIVIIFGPLKSLLFFIPVCLLGIWLASHKTPFDLGITKDIQPIIYELPYSFFFVVVIFLLLNFIGIPVVMQNLPFYYMLAFLAYIGFGYIVYALTSFVAPGTVALRIGVFTLLNWWLITTFGLNYLNFLSSLNIA